MTSFKPTRAMDNISIRKRRIEAELEIIKLDQGTKRWTMSIPHNFHYDSDHIFGVVLDDLDYLLAENARLFAQVARFEHPEPDRT